MISRKFAVSIILVLCILAALGNAITISAQTLVPAPHPTLETPRYGRVISNANLRAGPGTHYPIVGSVKAGAIVAGTGCNTVEICDWVVLENGMWIAGFLIGEEVTPSPVLPSATPTKSTPTAVVTLPPMTEDERDFWVLIRAFTDMLLKETRDYGRYWNLDDLNPGVRTTYLWRSNMSRVFINASGYVNEAREHIPFASNPPLSDTFEAHINAVEEWAFYGQNAVWSVESSQDDWEPVFRAYDKIVDTFEAMSEVLMIQEGRWDEETPTTTPIATRTRRPTRTPHPTVTSVEEPGSAETPTPRPTSTLRP